MAKVNEELKARLVFEIRESEAMETLLDGKQIIVSTKYDGIYRQYSFHDDGTNSDTEMAVLYEEIKNILTHLIERALNTKRKYMNGQPLSQQEKAEAKRMGL